MPYNTDKLYIPRDFNTITEELRVAYNLKFNTNFTMETFKNSNVYQVAELYLQESLKNDNLSGILYDNIVDYLTGRQDLKVKEYGVVYQGFYNYFSQQSFIKNMLFFDHNKAPSNVEDGHAAMCFEYEQTPENDQLIADAVARQTGAAGITWDGTTVPVDGHVSNGNTYPVKWYIIGKTALKVKLHYVFDRNYYGQRLLPDDIRNQYLTNFNTLYVQGNDLKPAVLNDISTYPSLAYVNTEISTDGGANYLPLNQIMPFVFNNVWTLTFDDIELILDS